MPISNKMTELFYLCYINIENEEETEVIGQVQVINHSLFDNSLLLYFQRKRIIFCILRTSIESISATINKLMFFVVF